MENSLSDEVFVTKEYYKDGKFKVVYATYKNDGIELLYTKYTSVDSGDSITEYKYEFDMVTDEDVKMPDLSEYKIERKEN